MDKALTQKRTVGYSMNDSKMNDRAQEREKNAKMQRKKQVNWSVVLAILGAIMFAFMYYGVRGRAAEYEPDVIATPSPSPSPTLSPTPTPLVAIELEISLPTARGDHNDDVIRLQETLNVIGHFHNEIPHLAENGSFGPITESAVVMFQELVGIYPDGIVNEYTWYMMRLARAHPQIIYTTFLELPTEFVTVTSVNFRAGPSRYTDLLDTFVQDTRVFVLEYYCHEWVRVESMGQIGYVSTRFLRYAGEY